MEIGNSTKSKIRIKIKYLNNRYFNSDNIAFGVIQIGWGELEDYLIDRLYLEQSLILKGWN